jgi:hypothetical protein
MRQDAGSVDTAVGFRVKSGWVTVVLVARPVRRPRVLDRRKIDLCDPAVPESRQPYHAGMGMLETDEKKVKRRREIVLRCAHESVTELLSEYRNGSHRLGAGGLVVGSEIDPATVGNPHIRAHALEGQLFRTALQEALEGCGLRCIVIVERNAYRRAAEILRQPEDELKRVVAEFGRSLGRPWRADEKMACLVAWLALV